ncbi:DUF3306 domain-containing protein [Methylobacterium sp. J-090]|uniref:DUF3306 domain-containing protein n=1 Tax=Methylobacterium sp. J-090 TaxID=2836666 RepID=UPI001FBA6A19|nr:DUF3306 domain-containing protein [Methylobacterium sp. J-090]MCJ2080329.1 DUF3306 domain-containing protein [Methylobacterium sp. J-090]
MSDGFLTRWARRKRDVRESERTETPPTQPQAVEIEAVPGDAVASDAVDAEAEIDVLAELPSLDDLTAETDLLPFLRAGVPAALRNAALRKMWSVDPAIRDFVSEAREYAYDWNTPGGVPGLGPLLPGDDVKAMLRRLFNRDPSETAEAEAVAPEADRAGAAQPDPALAPDSVNPSEAAETAPAPKLLTEPILTADPANSPERTLITSINTVTVPRLRRHGGAMPS